MFHVEPRVDMECSECQSRKNHEIAEGNMIKTVCEKCGHSRLTGMLPVLPESTKITPLEQQIYQMPPVVKF